MAVKKVLLFGDPELRRKSKRVQDLPAKEVEAVMRDLKDTLKSLKQKHKRGGGLSAVQIGKRVQIIYIEVKRHSFFMINPKIIKKSRRKIEVWDFCFSGAAAITAPIKRHKSITVEFTDEKCQKRTETYVDYWSELMQHEIDHLDGILFIDYIKEPQRIMMVAEWNRHFKYKQD